MKKIILSGFLLLFVSIFISLAEAGEYINHCPVPDNLKIIEPDRHSVPPKLALLSGIWEGNWASAAIFIVEQIKGKEAVVVSAWAGFTAKTSAGRSSSPGFVRVNCPIEEGGDGNYRIICTVPTGTNRLIQTDDPKHIRVMRDGFGNLSTHYRDTIFRKAEMK